MSLVFAGISPHPPLLIPTIGRGDIAKKIHRTKESLDQMEEDLYLTHPDTLLIISPHASLFANAFTLNFCPEYETDLREFGDIATKINYQGDHHLASYIYDTCKREHVPLGTISEKFIDYGSTIPLYFLTRHLPDIKIVIVGFSELTRKEHFDFGYLIKEQIMKTNRRIAVIASGDMSHALSNDSPAPFSASGKWFDTNLQELLTTGNSAGILKMDEKFVNDASVCGYRSLLILLGILRGVKYTYKLYSYEAPFGVGYLTANFVL